MEKLPKRCSLRLRQYDYANNGAYFVTICTHERRCVFGEIKDDTMRLNELGRLVTDAWTGLPRQYKNVELDEFVVMPNHLHGIIVLSEAGTGAMNRAPTNAKNITSPQRSPSPAGAQFIAPVLPTILPTLGEIVRTFKARCTSSWRKMNANNKSSLWQRNYYEHVIRNEMSIHSIREYVVNNPTQWSLDHENPNRQKIDGRA